MDKPTVSWDKDPEEKGMMRRFRFGVVFGGAAILAGSAIGDATDREGAYPGKARDGPFSVEVSVVVDQGKIRDITFIHLPDWKTVEVKRVMRQRIMGAQSVKVDGVTGATLSSDLIKKAVQAALRRASVTFSPLPVASPSGRK